MPDALTTHKGARQTGAPPKPHPPDQQNHTDAGNRYCGRPGGDRNRWETRPPNIRVSKRATYPWASTHRGSDPADLKALRRRVHAHPRSLRQRVLGRQQLPTRPRGAWRKSPASVAAGPRAPGRPCGAPAPPKCVLICMNECFVNKQNRHFKEMRQNTDHPSLVPTGRCCAAFLKHIGWRGNRPGPCVVTVLQRPGRPSELSASVPALWVTLPGRRGAGPDARGRLCAFIRVYRAARVGRSSALPRTHRGGWTGKRGKERSGQKRGIKKVTQTEKMLAVRLTGKGRRRPSIASGHAGSRSAEEGPGTARDQGRFWWDEGHSLAGVSVVTAVLGLAAQGPGLAPCRETPRACASPLTPSRRAGSFGPESWCWKGRVRPPRVRSGDTVMGSERVWASQPRPAQAQSPSPQPQLSTRPTLLAPHVRGLVT